MQTKQRNSSFGNALKLLKSFTMDEPEMDLSKLSEKLDVGISTAHRLASTLVSVGFLTKDPQTRMYRPGTSILALGNIVSEQMDLFRNFTPFLESLMIKTGETVHIGILRNDRIFYLQKVESPHPIRLLSHVGRQNPIHNTSMGQAILAYKSEKEIDQVIALGLERHTDKTITSPEQFRLRLEEIKAQGFAVSIEELNDGVTSIAAPILNRVGKVVASVSIAGPVERIHTHSIPRFVKMVTETANEISEQMKQTKPSKKNKKGAD